MKRHIHKAFVDSEGAITSFFQKLPEILILLAIPVALFAYIFVRPQMTSEKNNKIVNKEITSEEAVDDDFRALMGDVQKDMTNGSSSATLEGKVPLGTPAAILDLPKLDLVGPWSCESSDESGVSSKLYIESKQIKMITQSGGSSEHYLIKDSCLYTWIQSGNGKKQCTGISDMLSIAEFAAQSGLIDISSVLGQSGVDESGKFTKLIASCKKSPVGSFIFTLPQGIKWVEDNTLLEGVKE